MKASTRISRTKNGAEASEGVARRGADTPKKNSAGRPTAEEMERRKAVIMQEATRLFLAQGYAATSLLDIGRAAGVASRTLYQHFGDKEAIFRDVMYARQTAYAAPAIEGGETLFDVLVRTADYACDMAYPTDTVNMLRLAIAESQRFPSMMRDLIDTGHRSFRKSLKTTFDRLVALGYVRDTDTEAAARIFLHLIVGDTALMILAGWKPPTSGREDLTHKVELFIQGRWGEQALKTARTRRRAA